jgi:FAD/FMN-containing dehydrogenase
VDRPPGRDAAAAIVAAAGDLPVLAHGCGRSYGDVALNDGGRLIDCRGLDRFIAFDRATGILTAEAGVRLADILSVICRPDADGGGWMLPVTPGTRYVTLGGAIANDVHGKNHHGFGTFGCHVLSFELARSDGSRLVCSADHDPGLFAATIGGLGLTGLILSATIRMRRVPGLAVEAQDIRFDSLADYFALAEQSDSAWEYTAAWIDCLARGPRLGRGIFSRARHVAGRGTQPPPLDPRRGIPVAPPVSMVTPATVRLFNAAYLRKPLAASGRTGSYEKVFYPLDAIGGWNLLYGPRGFYQFQCVVPTGDRAAVLAGLLDIVAASGQGSMLSVLKLFGDRLSPGMLSFPRPGATLALDFVNLGPPTVALLARLERHVTDAGGRLYPAKDALMTAVTFRAGYPAIERFRPHIDPRFASGFARRVGLAAAA